MLLNVTNRSVLVVLPPLNSNGVQESVLVLPKMCMSNDISQWSPKLTIQAVKDASPWTALISIEWTSIVNLTVILISCLFWCRILFSSFTNQKEWLLTSWCLSVCLSVFPYGTPRLPLYGFSWNLIFEHFLKYCWENSSLIKIGQE
jgi:hypothetical protein